MPAKSGISNAIPGAVPTENNIPVARPIRGDDSGQEILPQMEHFVTLARRVKQPRRLMELVEHVCDARVPQELNDAASAAKAALIPAQRRKLYQWMTTRPPEDLIKLEQASDRISALKDEFGTQAVFSLLDNENESDETAMADPTDKFTRVLYLFLSQQYPADPSSPDRRFEQAEWQQSINHQWSNQEYASHYLGPKAAAPKPDAEIVDQLRERIATLFEGIDPKEILVHHFIRVDRSHASRHENTIEPTASQKLQHTITATFNGTKAFFKQVANHEVVEMEEPAAVEVMFSWEPESGTLGVFCPDKAHRADLAAIFQNVVLGSDTNVTNVPMCTFELDAFGSAAILAKIDNSLIPGVNAVAIQKIRVSNMTPQAHAMDTRGRESRRYLASQLEISRDRRDVRDIYAVASNAYHLESFAGEEITRVNLTLSIDRQVNRKAHCVPVQITRPNGLNSRGKTAQDRLLVRQQLISLGILKEIAPA